MTENSFPFMHVSLQIYKHMKNKNGVPHCRSRYFVFMWTRKNRRQNRKKAEKTYAETISVNDKYYQRPIELFTHLLYTFF